MVKPIHTYTYEKHAMIPTQQHRKRLYALRRYYVKTHRMRLAQAIQKQIDVLHYATILPDVEQNCVAHCGIWHSITAIPFMTPCCHTLLFTASDDIALHETVMNETNKSNI